MKIIYLFIFYLFLLFLQAEYFGNRSQAPAISKVLLLNYSPASRPDHPVNCLYSVSL